MSKDDYNHEVPKGVIHLSGHFLEKDEKRSSLKSNVFKIASNKKTYFFMESIVYPYVNIEEGPGEYLSLSMQDYTEVLYYVEKNGFSHL